MKRILITGAAGFIGFHLSLNLKKRNDFVIGLDNFNHYYDVNLKKSRASILKENDIQVIQADINDTDALNKIISDNSITHVVNLAAQAGVRYSLKNPSTYVQSNLVGFVNLLEAIKNYRNIKFIFASSSSVYGLNETSPFCVNDKTDRPANLYGATKKANELIAFSYHNLYQIPTVGLRYFTVYGPYGRPDMAYYKFTKSIIEGKKIDLFNEGNMKRDFTYIDDIIAGTVSAIDYAKDFEIFNLGNNKPVDLNYFISLIEKKLNKKAKKNLICNQKGEMISTCANIDGSIEKLNFSPKTTIEEGMEKFLTWYLETYL
ncbi:MAG: NAD-dependent epimerase/dehydratase family protein [Parachlamydiales bacterium]|jgi:UDP-glucuronate 4-epimerase